MPWWAIPRFLGSGDAMSWLAVIPRPGDVLMVLGAVAPYQGYLDAAAPYLAAFLAAGLTVIWYGDTEG
jgi:membrane protein DedA with SNARE-associated domain